MIFNLDWTGLGIMRTAAVVLGTVDGVFGIIARLLAMLIGGIGAALEAKGSELMVLLGLAAIMLAVIGIIGGALAHRSLGAATILLEFSDVFGFFAISRFWVLSGILWIADSILGFVAWAQSRQPTLQPATPSSDSQKL